MRKDKLLKHLDQLSINQINKITRALGTTPNYLRAVALGHRNFSLERSQQLAELLGGDFSIVDIHPRFMSTKAVITIPAEEYASLKTLARKALDAA